MESTTTPSWAARAVQAPTVPPNVDEPRSDRTLILGAAALIAIGLGVGGFFIGRGIQGGSGDSIAATVVSTTAAPTTAPPTTAAPTTAAPSTTASSTTAAPSTTAPATTVAPPSTAAPTTIAEPTAVATPTAEPNRTAVLSAGVLHLRGTVPSQEVADIIVERAAAVIGAENVVVEYVIDPTAPMPASAPLYVDDVVLFAYGSEDINPAFTPLLDLGTALLTQNPGVTVTVVSHTDTDGSAEFNLALSQRRGAAVAAYWIERGIDPSRILIDARGETQPLADETTPDGAQANRRAEFIITGLLG